MFSVAMDTAASDIRAVEFTPSRDGDSPILQDLLDQIAEDEQIGSVTADGAYDTRRCHSAILARDAVPIIPIRKNAQLCKEDCSAACARNETLRATRYRRLRSRLFALLRLGRNDAGGFRDKGRFHPARFEFFNLTTALSIGLVQV